LNSAVSNNIYYFTNISAMFSCLDFDSAGSIAGHLLRNYLKCSLLDARSTHVFIIAYDIATETQIKNLLKLMTPCISDTGVIHLLQN